MGPITFGEIEAYQRLMGLALSPWDVLMIRRIDDAIQLLKAGPAAAPSISETKARLRAFAARKAAQAAKKTGGADA